MTKLFIISTTISNLLLNELMFRCPLIKFLKFSNCCTLIDTKSDRESFTESDKGELLETYWPCAWLCQSKSFEKFFKFLINMGFPRPFKWSLLLFRYFSSLYGMVNHGNIALNTGSIFNLNCFFSFLLVLVACWYNIRNKDDVTVCL